MANKKGKYTLVEYCKLNNRDDLLFEWDYEKNVLKPDDYASGSSKKVWWNCSKCGCEYEASIVHRNGGTGCPRCRGQKAAKTHEEARKLRGDTFGNMHPELLKQWDYEKNIGIDPFSIAVNHGEPIWWKCEKDHSWRTLTRNRLQGKGCPYCANKKAWQGFNDLESLNPEFLKEWDYEKNDVLPSEVTRKCNKKVWWKCKEGHEWQAVIASRYNAGCPICGNKQVLVGYNDLETTHPELVKEWDYEKNDVLPTQVVHGSDGFYWWKCAYGHSWRAKITNRVHGTNCPKCTTYLRTSFQEQAIFYYVQKAYPDAVSSDYTYGFELDVYIPSIKSAIEYDGFRWHQDIQKDIRKNEKCKRYGINLIRVRENGCPIINVDGCYIIMEDNHEKYFQNVLKRVLSAVNVFEYDIDLLRDRAEILSQYMNSKYENSLECKFPDIAKEWHPSKNRGLLPRMVAAGTQKKVWWLCSKGHEYQTAVWSKTGNAKVGCPICSNKKVVAGINDLETKNPEMLSLWDYEKNDILPSQLTPTSNRKVWWRCERGHEWIDNPYTVLKNQKPCPICGRRKLLKGFNDFETLEPELMKEWNYEKNDILPSDFVVGKAIHVWWKCCTCGNEWKANVQNRRTGFKNSCPRCADAQRSISRRKYIANSGMALEDRFPKVAEEWHPTKNKDLSFDASNVGGTVQIKVWWQCKECGYEWQAQIAARTRAKTGCPMCYRKKLGKRVINVDTGEVFQNARVASEKYNCSPGNITACCNGKIHKAKGCSWKYDQ